MFGFIILYLDILPPWEPDNNIFMCKIMQISTISVIWLQRVLSPPTIMIFIFSLLHSVSNLTWKHKSLVSRIRWIIIIFYVYVNIKMFGSACKFVVLSNWIFLLLFTSRHKLARCLKGFCENYHFWQWTKRFFVNCWYEIICKLLSSSLDTFISIIYNQLEAFCSHFQPKLQWEVFIVLTPTK